MSVKIVRQNSQDDVVEMKIHTWLANNLKKKYENAWYYKAPGGRYGRKGVPDFLVNISGLFIAIEVKRIKGKLTPFQENELNKINSSGGLAIVMYGKSNEVFDVIDKHICTR